MWTTLHINSYYASVGFRNMVNSYFKTNLLRLVRSNQTNISLNSVLEFARLTNFFNLDIDTNLFNENVFANTTNIYLIGKIKSIQVNLF